MRPIKRAIILCWIMLVACFAIKLFGGNWFEVVCTNEHFSKCCEYLDKNIVLQDLLAFSLYLFGTYLMILSCSLVASSSKKQKLAIFLSFSVCFLLNYVSEAVKFATEALCFIVLPIFITATNGETIKSAIKSKWYCGFVGMGLIFAFQLISMYLRDVDFWIMHENTLTSLMLLIDYYIMIVLYHLYVKLKKGGNKNG